MVGEYITDIPAREAEPIQLVPPLRVSLDRTYTRRRRDIPPDRHRRTTLVRPHVSRLRRDHQHIVPDFARAQGAADIEILDIRQVVRREELRTGINDGTDRQLWQGNLIKRQDATNDHDTGSATSARPAVNGAAAIARAIHARPRRSRRRRRPRAARADSPRRICDVGNNPRARLARNTRVGIAADGTRTAAARASRMHTRDAALISPRNPIRDRIPDFRRQHDARLARAAAIARAAARTTHTATFIGECPAATAAKDRGHKRRTVADDGCLAAVAADCGRDAFSAGAETDRELARRIRNPSLKYATATAATATVQPPAATAADSQELQRGDAPGDAPDHFRILVGEHDCRLLALKPEPDDAIAPIGVTLQRIDIRRLVDAPRNLDCPSGSICPDITLLRRQRHGVLSDGRCSHRPTHRHIAHVSVKIGRGELFARKTKRRPLQHGQVQSLRRHHIPQDHDTAAARAARTVARTAAASAQVGRAPAHSAALRAARAAAVRAASTSHPRRAAATAARAIADSIACN